MSPRSLLCKVKSTKGIHLILILTLFMYLHKIPILKTLQLQTTPQDNFGPLGQTLAGHCSRPRGQLVARWQRLRITVAGLYVAIVIEIDAIYAMPGPTYLQYTYTPVLWTEHSIPSSTISWLAKASSTTYRVEYWLGCKTISRRAARRLIVLHPK